MPLTCENVIKKVDKPVAMARYAQIQAKEMHGVESEYIPHAVEPEIYRPVSDDEKLSLRKKWGQILGVNLTDKFIIGLVARNQGRKMLDKEFEAMALIAKRIPNAVLLAHTDKWDPACHYNTDVLIKELGLENRIVFTGTKYFKGFDYKIMYEIYNLMDIFMLSTSGEGFGIPTIEAMACCVPIVITDYTTSWEIVERNKAGELVKLKTQTLGTWNVGRGIWDSEDACEKVVKLYNDPLLRKEYGLNGRSAILREYTWSIVAKQWDTLLTGMIQ